MSCIWLYHPFLLGSCIPWTTLHKFRQQESYLVIFRQMKGYEADCVHASRKIGFIDHLLFLRALFPWVGIHCKRYPHFSCLMLLLLFYLHYGGFLQVFGSFLQMGLPYFLYVTPKLCIAIFGNMHFLVASYVYSLVRFFRCWFWNGWFLNRSGRVWCAFQIPFYCPLGWRSGEGLLCCIL